MRRTKVLGYLRVFTVMIWMASTVGISVQAENLNEWTFESDASGLQLSDTLNVGSSSPLTQFGPGFGSTVFTTNRALICIGTDDQDSGVWTNGAVLSAALTSTTSGVHYLRYDVAYNLNSSTNNNGGMVLGTYFTGFGQGGDKAAGLALGYSVGGTLAGAVPATRRMTAVTTGLPWTNGLPLSGTLTAIAEIRMTNNLPSPYTATLKVWYGLNGSTPTDYSAPAFTTNMWLASITNLQFQATGDFRPTTSSTNYAAVDNIRTADNWADISAPIPDFSKGPKLAIARIIITTPKGTFTNSSKTVVTALGATNTVELLIRSLGSPASNIISSVASAANPGYSSITSGNTPATGIVYPKYVTNTFSVIISNSAPDDTNYIFNVDATADGFSGVSTNFSLTAGALITYKTNSITVFSTDGLITNKYAPGDVLDITVTSANVGLRPVSNIVNSLSADPSYFTINNLTSTNYAVLAVDAATSTVYRVTILPVATHGTHWFGVTNQSGALVWPDSFPIDVFKQGIPSVSPTNITINLLVGSVTNNTDVVVTNKGNAACSFAITDDSPWGTFYKVTTGTRGISDFVTAKSTVVLKKPVSSDPFTSSTNAGVSSAAGIGFGFPFYGTVYSNFYVTADGYIGLINTTNAPTISVNRAGALVGGSPLIAPFWGRLISPAGSIKTIFSKKNYLVISYSGVSEESGGTKLQFQVALFTNGCIEFRYKSIVGLTNSFGTTNVTIGIQGSKASYQNLAVKPVNGTSVRLTPQRNKWISYPTQDIGIDRQGSARITFTADASGMTVATSTTFGAWFNWSTGGSNAVAVTVNVVALAPVYSAVANLSFTGTAAQVTSARFVITNAGTSPLTFTITDTNVAIAGYTSTNAAYKWIDISSTGTKISLITPSPVNPNVTAADEGFSAMIPLKFSFPFYGGIYTQFSASVNGALRLDTTGRVVALQNLSSIESNMPAQMIAPYWGNLALDANATLKYLSTAEQLVVTWENVQQYGLNGGSDLTFQAILKPNGGITFQYKKLEGYQWPRTAIGLRDTAVRTKQVYILQPGDWISSTNQYGAVSTQYVNTVGNRAVQFHSAYVKVIGYTPSSGSIPAGSNAVITITGDASSQSVGTNRLSTNTTLVITHNASTNVATLAVTFTTTNSLEVVFLRAAAVASDGAGLAASAPPAVPAFAPKVEGAPGAISLSWTAPQDGAQRVYTIYSTTDLMSGWTYLAAVTNATTYLDTRTIDVPTIYYKITAE